MQYEVYIDSLFLVHFMMNFYVLVLVNRCTNGTATPGRILFGALLGTLGSILVLLLHVPLILKVALEVIIGSLGNVLITFRVKGLRNRIRLLERMLLISACMGGILSGVTGILRIRAELLAGGAGLLVVGGVLCLFLKDRFPPREWESHARRVTLIRGENRVTAEAIIDTGNSLREPISGKPVSVVDEQIFLDLWGQGEREYYRAVPYHSIGRPKGILRGYLLPELRVEHNGMEKVYRNLYIAVSPEGLGGNEGAGTESVKMIINPLLLQE